MGGVLRETFIAFTPMFDRLRLAGTLEIAGHGRPWTRSRLENLTRAAQPYLRDINEADITAEWAGYRPCTPDGMPMIGEVPWAKGLVVATGHAMMGMTLGPITGRLVAEIFCDGTTVDRIALARSGAVRPRGLSEDARIALRRRARARPRRGRRWNHRGRFRRMGVAALAAEGARMDEPAERPRRSNRDCSRHPPRRSPADRGGRRAVTRLSASRSWNRAITASSDARRSRPTSAISDEGTTTFPEAAAYSASIAGPLRYCSRQSARPQ